MVDKDSQRPFHQRISILQNDGWHLKDLTDAKCIHNSQASTYIGNSERRYCFRACQPSSRSNPPGYTYGRTMDGIGRRDLPISEKMLFQERGWYRLLHASLCYYENTRCTFHERKHVRSYVDEFRSRCLHQTNLLRVCFKQVYPSYLIRSNCFKVSIKIIIKCKKCSYAHPQLTTISLAQAPGHRMNRSNRPSDKILMTEIL